MFGKLFKKTAAKKPTATVVPMKNIDYPPKIILAWAKAIEGNQEILGWLKDNDYDELFYASYAIRLKTEARDWLTKNGYPQLMAFVNACEGNEKALRWLQLNSMDLLYYMALAIDDNDVTAIAWLQRNGTPDLIFLAKTIKAVKDNIEENHNDIHSFGRDD
ncbi:MAG: hypothetical protein V4638_06765 [Bacteroidota bacterium]